MKKHILLATAALLMSVATFAQKLGHTDGQTLLYSLPEMTKVSDDLAKATKEYENELNTMKADYEAKVKEFEANMKTAGKGIQTKIFDAQHAFANPSNPAFDKAATEEAWGMAITYFKARLK
jgi:carboxymethylenebutenolidase